MSSFPRTPRRHLAPRKFSPTRTALIAVSILLLTLFLFGYGALAQKRDQFAEAERLFVAKADKLLKQVRAAAEDDRAAQAEGRLKGEGSHVERLRRVAGIERKRNGAVTVSLTVRLTGESDAELRAAGFEVGTRIGDIATVETDVERLPELAALSSVKNISAARMAHPLNDRARQSAGVDNLSGQRVVSQTGRGVVVGIIDTGIDFRHLDFTVPGSGGKQTRIKALLDMTVFTSTAADWNYTLPGGSRAVGHLYTEADINAALAGNGTVNEKDKNGHGTHVTGTAAGNGLSSPTPGTYAGMAPEADLVIVKASRQNDGTDSFRTSDILNAMTFIQVKAAELGEPFVINMSLGDQAGPHDGTGLEERAIDNLIWNNATGGAGRAVCVAAGNEGDANIHARATVPAGGSLTLTLNAVSNPQIVDLYPAASDRYTVTVAQPDGIVLGPVTYSSSVIGTAQASNANLDLYNARDDKGDSDPSNDQPDIFLVFKSGAPTGSWTITLQDADSNANQPFDAWAEGDDVSFSNFVDNSSHLVGSPGTSRSAITVGAFVTRSASQVIGAYAPFTSPGPTADGRQKPDISAPGYYLYSSRSADVTASNFGTLGTGSNSTTDSAHYTGLAGTSMATPVVTGAVALLLQANSVLTSDQIKSLLIQGATHDGFTGSGWDAHFGNGKLNIANALAPGSAQTFTISGHIDGFSGLISVVLTGTRNFTNNVDSSGNYSFTKLPAGGNYTVTPTISATVGRYTITPPSQTFNNLSANQVANFKVTETPVSISGHIIDTNGKPAAGVNVYANKGFLSVPQVTDANGFYQFTNLTYGITYSITPESPNYKFNPVLRLINNLNGNLTADFVGSPIYTISGRVSDDRGVGIIGVPIFALGTGTVTSTNTDNNGNYSLSGLLPGGNYTVTFGFANFLFSPNSVAFTNLSGSQTLDFKATSWSGMHTISGRVTDFSGNNLPGVLLTISGAASGTALTDSNGFYLFRNLADAGPYTITVSKAGYNPTPASQNLSSAGPNPANINFIMSQGTNQIDDAQYFVTQHYRDFLNREPDAGGLSFWTNEITNCGADPLCLNQHRINVSAAFYVENEFQLTGSYVYRIYRSALGHRPTFAEFVPDRQMINPAASALDASKAAYADNFAQRAEFLQKYPASLSNAQFVSALLTNVQTAIGVDLSSQSASLTSSLDGGATRGSVLRAVAENPEVMQKEYNPAFVVMQYFGYLRRDPEDGGYLFWLDVLNNKVPNNYRGMVCAFITSAEYQARFGTAITRSNRDCQ